MPFEINIRVLLSHRFVPTLRKMAHCAAVGCNNKKANNKDKSLFKLPSEPTVRSAWLKKINRTALPKNIYLCSDHFTDDCFDKSWDIQSRHFYTDRPIQRRLLAGSLPSIFPHKAPVPEREWSVVRENKQKREEVTTSSFAKVHIFT